MVFDEKMPSTKASVLDGIYLLTLKMPYKKQMDTTVCNTVVRFIRKKKTQKEIKFRILVKTKE